MMTVRDSDLQARLGDSWWGGGMPKLRGKQRERILAYFGIPLSDHRQANIALLIEVRLAKYVQSVRDFAAMRDQRASVLPRETSSKAWKPTTVVSKERDAAVQAIETALMRLDAVSQDARDVIDRHARTRPGWPRAPSSAQRGRQLKAEVFDTALLVFVACRDCAEAGQETDRVLATEIAAIGETVMAAAIALEQVSPVLEELLNDLLRDDDNPKQASATSDPSSLVATMQAELAGAAALLGAVTVTKARGPDNVALKELIADLAGLWHGVTGEWPKRTHEELRPGGEAGRGEHYRFLEFVRLLVAQANRYRDDGKASCPQQSLSGLTRRVLDDIRAHDAETRAL